MKGYYLICKAYYDNNPAFHTRECLFLPSTVPIITKPKNNSWSSWNMKQVDYCLERRTTFNRSIGRADFNKNKDLIEDWKDLFCVFDIKHSTWNVRRKFRSDNSLRRMIKDVDKFFLDSINWFDQDYVNKNTQNVEKAIINQLIFGPENIVLVDFYEIDITNVWDPKNYYLVLIKN